MKTFKEFVESADYSYDKVNSQSSILNKGYYQIDGWEILNTTHSLSRQVDRDPMSQDDLNFYLTRLIKKITPWPNKVNKEFVVRSLSKNRSIVVNIDTKLDGDQKNPHQVKQIRVVTILDTGHNAALAGTPVLMIENVEYEVIEID